MQNTVKPDTKSTTTNTENAGAAPRTEKFEMPNPFAAFSAMDPMAMWTQTQATFQKAFTDAFARAQSFADQYATMESQFVTRAHGAVANWAQLTQDALAYGAQLSAESRKLGFDAARKMSAGA